jgi:hypothetical protein
VYLLAIFGNPEQRTLIDGDQLLYAARRLGPDRLLALSGGEAVIDDPDLPAFTGHIQRYVYSHADALLRPKDAGAVLALAEQSGHIDAYIAAATLAPRRASAILHQACDAKQGKYAGWERGQAAIALWRLVGETEADFLADWFFTDRSPDLGRAPYRADWAAFLLERFNASDRKLLARLLRDERFDEIDLPTHRLVVRGLNRNLLEPVIDPLEERNTSHPMGDAHFDGQIEQARTRYPKETDALLARLAQWRKKLRDSITRWETP